MCHFAAQSKVTKPQGSCGADASTEVISGDIRTKLFRAFSSHMHRSVGEISRMCVGHDSDYGCVHKRLYSLK